MNAVVSTEITSDNAGPSIRSEDHYNQYPKAQREFEREVDETLAEHPEAITEAEELLTKGPRSDVVTLNPKVAAAIHRHFNKLNRDFSYAKAADYAAAMRRGEWKLNHQGMAVYLDGTLGDGQHRNGAIIISGKEQQFMLFRGLDPESADTIDLSKGRNAGDALQLIGIADAKRKASIGKTVMEYRAEAEFGSKPKLSVIQVEHHVMEHDSAMTTSIQMGQQVMENISEPCMSVNQGATVAELMRLGGYSPFQIQGYLSSVQTGVATYEDAPTLELGRKLMRAKETANPKHKLTSKQVLALCAKAADLWVREAHVRNLAWNGSKEPLPKFVAPVIEE